MIGFLNVAAAEFLGAIFKEGKAPSSSENSKKSSAVDLEGLKTVLAAAVLEVVCRVGASSGDERRLMTSGMLTIAYEQLGCKVV